MIIQYNKISNFRNSESFSKNDWFLKSEFSNNIYTSYKITGNTLYSSFKNEVCRTNFNFDGKWTISGRMYNSSNLIESDLSAAVTIKWCYDNLISKLQELSSNLYDSDNTKLKLPSYVGMIIVSDNLTTESSVKNIYGGTKWEMIPGRFLLGTGENERNISGKYGMCKSGELNVTRSKKTGGSRTVKLESKNVPSHCHGIHIKKDKYNSESDTWNELPSSRFAISLHASSEGTYGPVLNGNEVSAHLGHSEIKKHRKSAGQHHNTWGNYATGVVSINDITGSGSISKSFSFTPKAERVSEECGPGIPHDNMPPYIAEYIWERIA